MPSIREQNRTTLDALRIRRDALLDAILDLEQTVAAPATDRVVKWAADVTRAMERLRVVLEHHIADTENAGGFFDDLLQEEPRLSRAVENLRADHDVLSQSVDELSVRLRARPAPTPTSIRCAPVSST